MVIWKTAADSLTRLRALVTALFVCALAGFALTVLFGFEEPNNTLLLVSSGLLLSAILAVFAHLGVTRILSRAEKRRWLNQLTGRRAVWAWGEYLTCDDLRAAAIRFEEEATARRCGNRSRLTDDTP
jgi:hypothetical protein